MSVAKIVSSLQFCPLVRVPGAPSRPENTPFFLALAAAYALLGGAPLPLAIVSSLYVVARMLQGYAQVRALQPQRVIFYLAGVVATLALAGLLALRV